MEVAKDPKRLRGGGGGGQRLISLRECAVLSEFLLGTHVIL